MLWSGCFALTIPGISKWVGWAGDWRYHRPCYWQTLGFSQDSGSSNSVMMQDFGDFARLGGFQNIKLYF